MITQEAHLSQASQQYLADLDRRIAAIHKENSIGGQDTAIDSNERNPYLSSQSLVISLGILVSQCIDLITSNKRWHDVQATTTNTTITRKETALRDALKRRNRLKVQSKEQEQIPAIPVQHQDTPPSLGASYGKLTVNGILLTIVMGAEIVFLSLGFQVFGDSKLLSFSIGIGFTISLALVYHYMFKLAKLAPSKFLQGLIVALQIALVLGTIIGTAVFRSSLFEATGKDPLGMHWFMLFTLFFNLAAFLLITFPIKSALDNIRKARIPAGYRPTIKSQAQELEEVEEEIKQLEQEIETAQNYIQEIKLVAESAELKIYHRGYQESISQWKFGFMTTKFAIPDSFLEIPIPELTFYFITPNTND